MPDYERMYYFLVGRMTMAVEALETISAALTTIEENLKAAQQKTEEIYMNSDDDNVDDDCSKTALPSNVRIFKHHSS